MATLASVMSDINRIQPPLQMPSAWGLQQQQHSSELHQDLLEAYAADTEWLSDPGSWGYLPVPSWMPNTATFPEPWFQFVGRSCFKDLREFAKGFMKVAEGPSFLGKYQAERPAQRRRVASVAGCEAYVIGTPGEGKSYMFAVLAGFLHSRGDHIVVYISALRFSECWSLTLRSSLMVAFVRDDTALSELASTRDENLLHWLRSKPKLMILVADYNELDGNRKLDPLSPDSLTTKGALAYLAAGHAVIYCCSSRSQVRAVLDTQAHPPYFVIAGGFSKEEFKTFQEHVLQNKDIPPGTLEQTGYNPRLLKLYAEGVLQSGLWHLRHSLRRFILDAEEVEYNVFVEQMAGVAADTRLPKVMDTRCFYVSASRGELMAISDHFKSTALSLCAARDLELPTRAVKEHIQQFTRVVELDDGKNMVRLGWNAEAATLLVLSKFSVTVPLVGCSWNFEASEVNAFRGGIEGASLEYGNGSVVHIPEEFNCKAVDVLLEGKMRGKPVCAGVQISASKDPGQASHEGAIARFCSVMKDCLVRYDIVVFIWIGYFPGNFPPRKIEVDGVELIEVTMSFSQLSPLLSDLDHVCQKVQSREMEAKERLPEEKDALLPDATKPQLCHIRQAAQKAQIICCTVHNT